MATPNQMITFAQACPVTYKQHSFTIPSDLLFSAKDMMNDLTANILWSTSREPGDSESRCRALMEVIYKVIAWEKGLLQQHPVIPNLGPFPNGKKRRVRADVEESDKQTETGGVRGSADGGGKERVREENKNGSNGIARKRMPPAYFERI